MQEKVVKDFLRESLLTPSTEIIQEFLNNFFWKLKLQNGYLFGKYKSKKNSACPTWYTTITRAKASSMHLKDGTSLLSTPLPFWTCIITLDKYK